MKATVDSEVTHKEAIKEEGIIHEEVLVVNDRTTTAQKHQGKALSATVISDVTEDEKNVTEGKGLKGGPTNAAHSILAKSSNTPKEVGKKALVHNTADSAGQEGKGLDVFDNRDTCSGKIDSDAISAILAAEKKITNQKVPVKGGPTAQAQKHSNEDISSQAMHDVTEGEKLITGQNNVVKGGPTAILQHNMAKCKLSNDKQHQSGAPTCCENGQDSSKLT